MDIQLEKKPALVRYKYHILAGGAFAAFIVYLFVASLGPQRIRYERENLTVAEVKQEKFMEYLDIEGIIRPKLTIRLNSVEGGSVERIVALDGSLLGIGDTILVLSNPELTRSIEDERDNLLKQQVSYREKQIQMERKSSELKRQSLETIYKLERLSKENTLNQEEYNLGIKSKAQYEVTLDEFRFNRENTRLLLEELQHDSLLNVIQSDLMLNDLKREEKRFERNLSRLNDLVVRAPFDGQLSFVNVIPGERVAPGSDLGELKIVDQVKLSAKISEYYIDRISAGLPATIAYLNERYPLRIIRINPEVKDRQFDVDLLFTGKQPENIRIGKNYRLQIELGQPEDALIIDRGSFFQSSGGQWIFRLSEAGDKALRTNIVIGRQNPRQYEILDGLRPGDRVIVSDYEAFGDAVEIILK